ncbi:hypothetical protein NLU13_7329 [Sarocladium strictum]|uniref:Clr5 domain-containing protein n=1 Tax=Sarocladium strictum TaxID=5046 RepID=A0AA39GD53_SARSR|nr:hypothetical protein NLU13_7329 [Sarocladium strictum]
MTEDKHNRPLQGQLGGVASRPAAGQQDVGVMPVTTVPPSISVAGRRSHKDHTAEEWEALRPRFAELYLLQRLRLADVSRILRDECGFHATDKQYKDRIRKWGLKKNFKDAEKREALLAGVQSNRDNDQVALHQGEAAIPRHRLKRFARDAKLMYVQRAAAGETLSAEPRLKFDMVLELSRSLFHAGRADDERTLYDSFAAIDRLSSQRVPFLAFEVLGISDSVVRYGLRRLERRSTPGVAFEMMRPSKNHRGGNQGLGIRYCGSLQTLMSAYKATKEDDTHVALYHMISLSLYKACQYVYSPGSNSSGQRLYQERRTVYRPASNPLETLPIRPGDTPEVRCVQYNASAQAAQALYLRTMAQSLLSLIVRNGANMPDGETLSSPQSGLGFRIAVNPQTDFIVMQRPGANLAIHYIKHGDLVAGALQFQRGYEDLPVFMEARIEQEGMNMLSLARFLPGQHSPQGSMAVPEPEPWPFLTDADSVEAEFVDAAHRAAAQATGSVPWHPGKEDLAQLAIVSRPLTAAEAESGRGRVFNKLVEEAMMLDWKQPWKRVTGTESTGETSG